MGTNLNERVFKVLGNGGLAVTDVTPAYREWFAEEIRSRPLWHERAEEQVL